MSGVGDDKVPNFLLDNVPILDSAALASQSPSSATSSLRSRNGIYSSGLPYPAMSYMKKRPYRTQSGSGTPVYTNIHQLRYSSTASKYSTSSKASQPSNSADHTPKKGRTFSSSRSYPQTSQFDVTSTPNQTPKHLDSTAGGSTNKKLDFSNISKYNTSEDSFNDPDDSNSSIGSSISVIHPASSSHFAGRNGTVFSKTPSSDNLGMTRQQKKLHDSPSSFSDTHRTLKEQHRISTLGLGIKIPHSPDRETFASDLQQLKTPDSMIYENSPIKNPEDFPLVNFSSRRSNASHKNSPASALRNSSIAEDLIVPISVHSDSLDELFNDVIPDRHEDYENEKSARGEKRGFNIKTGNILVTSDENGFKRSSINEINSDSESSRVDRTFSFNEKIMLMADISRFSDDGDDEDEEDLNKAKIYKLKDGKISGFKVPIDEDEESITIDDIINKNFDSSNQNSISSIVLKSDLHRSPSSNEEKKNTFMNNNVPSNNTSNSIAQPADASFSGHERRINTSSRMPLIPSNEADAELENKIKSLLLIKKKSTTSFKALPESKQQLSLPTDSNANLTSSSLLVNEDTKDFIPKAKVMNDASNGNDDTGQTDRHKSYNNKTDLYLDRFPNFSMAPDLISPPRSPTKNFISSASSTPLHLQIKNSDHDGIVVNNERNSVDAIIEESEEDVYKERKSVLSGTKNQIPTPTAKLKETNSISVDTNIAGEVNEGTAADGETEKSPISPKKLSFQTRSDSQTVINWNVSDPEAWTIERVIKWLNLYNFNQSWLDTFTKYHVCHEKFLELTNDDQFSKFNTYLKLNNEYLDFGPATNTENHSDIDKKTENDTQKISNGNSHGKTDYAAPMAPQLSSSSRFRFLLKKTIEEQEQGHNKRAAPANDASRVDNEAFNSNQADGTSKGAADAKGIVDNLNNHQKISTLNNGNVFGYADDLKLLARSRKTMEELNRHGRSNSDDTMGRLMATEEIFKFSGVPGNSQSFGGELSNNNFSKNHNFAAPKANTANNNTSSPASSIISANTGTSTVATSAASNEQAGNLGVHSSSKVSGGGKRLSYIKRPFSVIESSKSKYNSSNNKDSPLSPYSAIFKRSSRQHDSSQGPSFVSPTASSFGPDASSDGSIALNARSSGLDSSTAHGSTNFIDSTISNVNTNTNNNVSHDFSAKNEPYEKKSGFSMKTFLKKDKIRPEFKQFSNRKNSDGNSPVSPVSSTSFETNRRYSKEVVGHIQLTDKEFPKPLPKRSKHYILITKDNMAYVAIGEEKLRTVKEFKENMATALCLPLNDLSRLSFHMTDYDSEYGAKLSDSTINSLIMFSFINYEVKFFVHYDAPLPTELTHSNTQSTRSTKSSDTASFEIAADNKVAYPATPSSLINDGSQKGAMTRKGEEVDYLNFKETSGLPHQSSLSPPQINLYPPPVQSGQSLTTHNDSFRSSFNVIRPETNKKEINFDKKRESPFVKTRTDLIPHRPAPAPPTTQKPGLQRSSSVSKRVSKSSLLNKEVANFSSVSQSTISENEEIDKFSSLKNTNNSISDVSSDQTLRLDGNNTGADLLRRSGTLLRRSSVRHSDPRLSRLSARKSLRKSGMFDNNQAYGEGNTHLLGNKFEENKISFEGVPSLDEESEESDDSDEDFWAMAPKPKIEANANTEDEDCDAEDNYVSETSGEKLNSGGNVSVAEKNKDLSEESERMSLGADTITSQKLKDDTIDSISDSFNDKRLISSEKDIESVADTKGDVTDINGNQATDKNKGAIEAVKRNSKDKWVVRPSTDIVYDNLEHFFPNTDLDKPIIYEVDTPPASPLDTRGKPLISPIKETTVPASRKEVSKSVPNIPTSGSDEVLMLPESNDNKKMSRNSRRKTIRGIAREYSIARRRLSQTAEAKNNSALLRRQSTKLWGRKVVELTSKDMKYDYISKLKNNKGEIKQFAWIKGELIGKGTYGKVFLALNVTTGEMMAVKQVDIPRTGYANKEMRDIIDALHLEVQTMKDLDHPNIVQYLGFEKVGNTYSLFLDYVAGGSVGSCLRMHGRFEEGLIRFLTRQVTDGLSYLHSRGILHRDLKADNLLLDLDGVCKITDFGISKRSENIYKNDSEMSMQGTIFWMAPEVIDNVVQSKKQGYSAKIDIWSLGCVVLEMFAGRRPWSNVEALSAMYRIGKTKLAPPIPDDIKPFVSADGKQFLNHCFEIDPNKRPTALELFQSSKFCIVSKNFDFNKTELATIIRENNKPKEFGRHR